MIKLALNTSDLRFYTLLMRLPLGNSYVVKLFAICFVGTHIPLIAVIGAILLGEYTSVTANIDILIPLLLATIVGTLFTLTGIRAALAPIMRSIVALRRYNEGRIRPDLPLDGTDEAGELMATVRIVCERLESELQQREKLAATDPLTGIANRFGFFGEAEAELMALRARKGEACLLLLDIDHFKSINDTYGHPAGDEVIRRVGSLLSDVAREGGAAGRLGGEEFALFLPDAPCEAAAAVGEALRRGVASLNFESCPGRRVTVSIGVSAVRVPEEATLGQAIERADHALYAAKEGGRDRIVIDPDSVRPEPKKVRAA